MTGQPDIAAALAWSGEAARAAANAQAALRGEPVPALLISSEAHLAEAEASPANPYGSSKHGRFDAGSAAEVAACKAHSEPQFVQDPASYFTCEIPAGHAGDHAVLEADGHVFLRWPQEPIVITRDELLADWRAANPGTCSCPGTEVDPSCPQHGNHLCPAQWGEPPETMLCSLPSGHDGNHATAEGIEWAGKWETAEPGDVTR